MARRLCECEGHTLDRLLQPTVLALFAESPLHGYAIVERLQSSPLMSGKKPDRTGLYRLLDTLEEQGVVTHTKTRSKLGPSKYTYELTDSGKECLAKWIDTLDGYQQAIAELVTMMRKMDCRISA